MTSHRRCPALGSGLVEASEPADRRESHFHLLPSPQSTTFLSRNFHRAGELPVVNTEVWLPWIYGKAGYSTLEEKGELL